MARARTTNKRSVSHQTSSPSVSPQGVSPSPPLFGQFQQAMSVETVSHEGPLPPPSYIDSYERILPGSAERIFKMAEDEQKHRHELEAKAIQSDITVKNTFQNTEQFRQDGIFKSDKRGQYLGFAISVLSLVGGFAAAYLQLPWQVTTALVGVPVLGMVKAITSSWFKERLPTDHPQK